MHHDFMTVMQLRQKTVIQHLTSSLPYIRGPPIVQEAAWPRGNVMSSIRGGNEMSPVLRAGVTQAHPHTYPLELF